MTSQSNIDQLIYDSGEVIFTGTSDPELTINVIASHVLLQGNSELLLISFNLSKPSSVLLFVGSTLEIQDNSTLIFTNNTVSNGAAIFMTLASDIVIVGEASLQVTNNSVNRSWMVLSAFQSYWMTNAQIEISDNVAHDGGGILVFNKTEMDLFGVARINLQSNIVKNGSIVAHIHGNVTFSDLSSFIVVDNSAVDSSAMLLVTGNITSDSEYVNITIANNSAKQQSYIIRHPIQFAQIDTLSYYINLFLDEYIVSPDEYEFPGPVAPIVRIIRVQRIRAEWLNRPSVEASLSKLQTQLELSPVSTIEFRGNFYFYGHTLMEESVGIGCDGCTIRSKGGKLMFTENQCQQSSHIMQLNKATTVVKKKSIITFTGNEMHHDSSLLLSLSSTWRMTPKSTLSVTENIARNGFLLLFFSTDVFLNGTVRLARNHLSDFGPMNSIHSTIWFLGSVEVVGNRAESGGITADSSDLFFTNNALFLDNQAANGRGVTLISSVMHISPEATVNFTRNHAERFGGAIFISKPRQRYVCDVTTATAATCSIQVFHSDSHTSSCNLYSLIFNQNKADIAGNAIYGGRTSACILSERNCYNCPFPDATDLFQYSGVNDSSDNSRFTSDPTRACFCVNGIPDCYRILNTVTLHPGEPFNLSLAVVGYGLGTVPGSVIARGNRSRGGTSEESLFGSELEFSQEIKGIQCQDVTYSVVSKRDNEQIALAVHMDSFTRSLKEVEEIVKFQLARNTENISVALRSPYDSVFETFFYIPIFLEISLLPCPFGFQLVGGKCICHQILLDNHIDTCSIFNGTGFILKPAPYWIGLPNDKNSTILLHPQCPFDYCQSKDISVTAESPNAQCQYHRSGVLCGSCPEGLSMILGSSECRTCSNLYLVSISIFFLMGVALVTVITLLNMTVSVGSLNGLILFANILQANRAIFEPSSKSQSSSLIAFLSTFIAWLNLDLGIPMCFFDGLTTYVKTWLQFVFPLYILALVGVMIIASNYSTRVTRLLGNNAVSVLATLVLLSYTKILRILITAFSFTTLIGSQGYHSVVWLADGNIKYLELKHTILFIVALLVLLLLGVPYTVSLAAAPWVQRSRFKWVSSLYNRFKPLFDAYMGPYKDNYRCWTGMLLLARVFLIVLFSSISNINTVAGPKLNLFLLTLSSSALLGLTAGLRPYKKKVLNGLEIFHVTNLLIFSCSNLYLSSIGSGTGSHAYIYITLTGISFLVFLGICLVHIWYRVRIARNTAKPRPPEIEEERYPRWQRARVRAEDEERGEVTISTASTNISADGGRRGSAYRESVLELASFDNLRKD